MPDLSDQLDLLATLKELRRRRDNCKLVIVLDQFEQWLHAQRGQPHADLSQALRQCDGQHLQALLMVRDEYWMPATRFMDELEVPLLQDKNFAAVDLFDPLHAHKVLAEFGLVLPDEVKVRVWDSTAEIRYLVVPKRPEGTEGLSEEALAALVTRDSMVGTGLAMEPAR